MSARYVLKQEDGGEYRFTLITHSGRVLLTSGIHTDRDSALRHISTARSLVRRSSSYEFLTSEDGALYFVLRNKQGELLGQSEMFPNRESMQETIIVLRGTSHGSRVEDQTPRPTRPAERPVKLW